MKKIIFTILTMCSALGLVWADEPECPPAATSTTTVSFIRVKPSVFEARFKVGDSKYVVFTRGNLQYNARYNSWRMAEHQYDVIRDTDGNYTAAGRDEQDAWIDLFGWGTSGFNRTSVDNYSIHYQPWEVSSVNIGETTNYYGYGPSTSVLGYGENLSRLDATKNYDWGVYNFVAGEEAGCRVLTKDEWVYLFSTRKGYRDLYSYGTLFGIDGIFLLPDDWTWSGVVATAATAADFEWTAASTDFTKNVIVSNDNGRALWNAMEDAGAVFLPSGGWRGTDNTKHYETGGRGLYWSSTAGNNNQTAYSIYYYEGKFQADYPAQRCTGINIRLVKDVTP